MSEEGKQTSRREFLAKTLRTTGYVLPLIVAVQMNSRAAWAQQYGSNPPEQQGGGGDNDQCNSFAEKMFNTTCWGGRGWWD